MDQGLSFLFATVHPADRDVLTTDIHAPVLARLTEDVRHQLADGPADMMGQLPLDLALISEFDPINAEFQKLRVGQFRA